MRKKKKIIFFFFEKLNKYKEFNVEVIELMKDTCE